MYPKMYAIGEPSAALFGSGCIITWSVSAM